jgi:superfamily II RNA helicase
MHYKHYILDPFQEQAIGYLKQNHSVVVCAATGTGKTLVADFLINDALESGKKIIYTAPIKALSNQKYRDFHAQYPSKIGLLTGDVSLNPSADVLIMTTEIYRNMLLEQNPLIEQLSFVIFDEIHFISDKERGTVWEESIIFSPPHIRFLALSATIPNYQQFAQWISHIKSHPVDTVFYDKRAVPLTHYIYDGKKGIQKLDSVQFPTNKHLRNADDRFKDKRTGHSKHQSRNNHKGQQPSHIKLVEDLLAKRWDNILFFSFSRSLCESRAYDLAKKHTLTTPVQRQAILAKIHELIPFHMQDLPSAQFIKDIVLKGIGVHHAGLLPKVKELVEQLFDAGFLKVLYATETFAVGINMPAKTVCFGSLEKYDGSTFRLIDSKEYFQLAGRAGRRGIDTVGNVISMYDPTNPRLLFELKELAKKDTVPIVSRYDLSYNTVLNLVKNHTKQQQKVILLSNFGQYTKKQQTHSTILQSFENYVRLLTKLGYIDAEKLTWKGDFASKVYTREIELAELVYECNFAQWTVQEILVTVSALAYEPKRSDTFDSTTQYEKQIFAKIAQNQTLLKHIKPVFLQKVSKITVSWFSQEPFEKILEYTNLSEGDIIRYFRQVIDMLRQIKGALQTNDPSNILIDKCNEILKKIDRDIVKVEL